MNYVTNLLDSFILSIWAGIVGGWMVSLNQGERSFKKSWATFETFILGVSMFFVYLAFAHQEYRGFGEITTIQLFLMIFLVSRLLRITLAEQVRFNAYFGLLDFG